MEGQICKIINIYYNVINLCISIKHLLYVRYGYPLMNKIDMVTDL